MPQHNLGGSLMQEQSPFTPVQLQVLRAFEQLDTDERGVNIKQVLDKLRPTNIPEHEIRFV
jgi:hypothetical protein